MVKNGWYGKIDLLIVEEDVVRLEDFKTGGSKGKGRRANI